MFAYFGSSVLVILTLAGAAPADEPKPAGGAKPKSIRVANQVEGVATIQTLLPDGASVKKGDLVCELDSSEFRDALLNQDIVVQQAAADLDGAVKSLEAAEIALKEAEEVIAEEIEAAEGDVSVAKSGLKIAKEKAGKAETDATKAEVLRAELALKKAEGQLKKLVRFTKARRTAEAEAAVAKAKADEKARRTILALQQSKAKKLRTKIERCKIVAPADGKVVLDQPRSPLGRDLVEEGATVRERQFLFRIVSE